MFKRLTIALVFALALTAVAPIALAQEAPPETPVTFIELAGIVAERDAEISGLAWYGDYLLLLTENPFIYATDEYAGMFYALDKADILAYLEAEEPEALEPMEVPIIAPDIVEAVAAFEDDVEVAFDGFESIVFVEDRAYLTIEADTADEEDETMRAYVVSGVVEPDLSAITLDLESYIPVPRQTEFNNMSYESMFAAEDALVLIYEVNGAAVNEEAVAYVVDAETDELLEEPVPFANVEYRITDVTALDADGVFWATNYFYAGEEFLATDEDPIFDEYGMGASQAEFDGFERLVAFEYTEDGIVLADTAPIQLEMTEESNGRNWEGIARLDDLGFLIATDKYPGTLLGFVAVEAAE